MKLFKTTAYAFAAAVAMCAFSACGGDAMTTEALTPPDPIPSPDPVEGILSAEDAKEYVEDTAIDFIGLFDARDQEAIVNLADFVAENYGDLDFPRPRRQRRLRTLAQELHTGSRRCRTHTHFQPPFARKLRITTSNSLTSPAYTNPAATHGKKFPAATTLYSASAAPQATAS